MSATPHVDLFDHVGLGLIINWPTGIVFSNQTGGTSCLAPQFEGVFIPIGNDYTNDDGLLSPQTALLNYFTGPRWRGTGAIVRLEEEDAKWIEGVLQRTCLFPAIRVNRSMLSQSHEAWVHVLISADDSSPCPVFSGFSPYPRTGVLTWQNSD